MILVLALIVLALLIAFWRSVNRDPRWIGNAFLVSSALMVMVLVVLGGDSLPGGARLGTSVLALPIVMVLLLSPLLLLVLIGFLLVNGVQMVRKEGRSLGNLLSLLAGLGLIVILVGTVLALLGTFVWSRFLLPFALLVILASTWAAYLFFSYLLYTLIYPRLVARTPVQYVMVHGSGLIRDRVPPLLAARVDAGIAIWRRRREEDPEVRLILSGGKGSDESRSEASAMAEHALEHGVPQSAILLEDRSATTAENLRNTSELVAREISPSAQGMAVTSSYHVLRTATLARRLGVDVQVQPARTAGYFWPSAFLREFVALIMQHPVREAIIAAVVCLPLPLMLLIVMVFQI